MLRFTLTTLHFTHYARLYSLHYALLTMLRFTHYAMLVGGVKRSVVRAKRSIVRAKRSVVRAKHSVVRVKSSVLRVKHSTLCSHYPLCYALLSLRYTSTSPQKCSIVRVLDYCIVQLFPISRFTVRQVPG